MALLGEVLGVHASTGVEFARKTNKRVGTGANYTVLGSTNGSVFLCSLRSNLETPIPPGF